MKNDKNKKNVKRIAVVLIIAAVAIFAIILGVNSGGGETEKISNGVSFVDVAEDAYYNEAVMWAVEKGIASGVDDLHFAPKKVITRAEMVTFLWRAAGSPKPRSKECKFTDVNSDSYYYYAVLWAVEKGITSGTGKNLFIPDITVNRGQAVTFIARMAGVMDDDEGYKHSFKDVTKKDYFNNAVAWASENGITSGVSDTEFSPKEDCLRSQIVTFLYRYYHK